ncbi:Bug family tripartite tricarboxylate transporter substrate binding protein [Bradyrhizobium sp.]|uniref:Bug family tripartite tricarboxylate transporter substrate binding protein n=1 Tax=Bradyrhizobium sp. TaxID=376 RepID=UPI003C6423FF
MNRTARLVFAFSVSLAGAAHAANDGSYPERTVRILVGFPPGGPPDFLAREFAQKFSAASGKPVIVENLTGAGGNRATNSVAKAAPDGYTLAMTGSPSIVISPALEKLPYNPITDLVPISELVITPIILVVPSDLPVKSVQELLALARSRPGQLTFGSAGASTPGHIAGELLKSISQIDIRHVPYKGIPPLLPDLLSGRISMSFTNISAVLPLLREGKLRALAVTSSHRLAFTPDIPTLAESGFPGFDISPWVGLMAPAKTSPKIIDALYKEIMVVFKKSDEIKRVQGLAMEMVVNSPREFSMNVAKELDQWAKLVQQAGIKSNE